MLVAMFLQRIQKLMSLLKETLIYLGNHWVVGIAPGDGELQVVYVVFYLVVQLLIFVQFFFFSKRSERFYCKWESSSFNFLLGGERDLGIKKVLHIIWSFTGTN